MNKRVIVATNNQNKAAEICAIMDMEGWEFLTLSQAAIESNPEEDAADFIGNARIKARAAFEASGGHAVLADDSGLEVLALDGAPGVHSARYAGDDATDEANNAKLLDALESIDAKDRAARFVCTMVFIDEDGTEYDAEGEVRGMIGFEERGADGFGYDPLFYPDELGGDLSFAEVPPARKNEISHRFRALSKLKSQIS